MAADKPKTKFAAFSKHNEAYIADSKYWRCSRCDKPLRFELHHCPRCRYGQTEWLEKQLKRKQIERIANELKYKTSDISWIEQKNKMMRFLYDSEQEDLNDQ